MTRDQYQRDYRQQYKDHAKRVNLTFSLSEYRGIARNAKDAGVPVAAYVKRLALDAESGRAPVPEDLTQQLADLERVIRTIANNVNQMARHSNRIAHVLDAQEVFLHIHTLQTELKASIARVSSGLSNAQSGDEDDGA